MKTLKVDPNDRSRAGQPASHRVTFGPDDRFAVQAIHSRRGEVQFVVFDAKDWDDFANEPRIIRQGFLLSGVLRGLEGADVVKQEVAA